MKILLICAAGMSTSILMKKMIKYAGEQGMELEIAAKGISEYEEICKDYDILLLGPQISYQRENIEKGSNKPVMVIAPYDYGVGNVENIFNQVKKVIPEKF